MNAREVRHALGHRFSTDEDGDDYCVGCGWNGFGLIKECRPDTPRCTWCRVNPADVNETVGGELFFYCAPCRNKLRVPQVWRCPWCETMVLDRQRFTEVQNYAGDVVRRWHDGCYADQQKAAYEIAGQDDDWIEAGSVADELDEEDFLNRLDGS